MEGLRKLVYFLLVEFILVICLISTKGRCAYFPQKDPDFKKAVAYYRNEDYEEALVIFKELYKKHKHPLISFYLGLSYKQVGEYEKAKKFFLKAIKGKPQVFDAYVELIQILYQLGEVKQALYWADKAESIHIFPDKIAFLKGLIYTKLGEFKKARSYFEQAKKINPKLSASADFQIGFTYVLERRYSQAKKMFESLIQLGVRRDLAELAKEYLSLVDRLVKSYKKWGIDIFQGLFYDSNVVNKPSETIGLPSVDEITGEEDRAWQSRIRAYFRPLLPYPYGFTCIAIYTHKEYFEWKNYNMDTINLSLTPTFLKKRITLSFPFTGVYNFLNGKEYSVESSLSPEFNYVKKKDLYRIGLGVGKRDMLSYIPGADPDEDRDAVIYRTFLGYNRVIAKGKGMLFLRGEYFIEDTDGKNWDSNSFTASGGIVHSLPLKGRLSLTLSAKSVWFRHVHSVTVDNYKNILAGLPPIPGFPTSPTKRKDEVYTFNLVLTFPIKKRFWISGSGTYLINNSNFPIYDYKKWIGGIELRLSF